MRKKEWSTPELVILVRSRPEENVLTHCKTYGTTVVNQDPYTPTGQDCKAAQGNCGACQSHKSGLT